MLRFGECGTLRRGLIFVRRESRVSSCEGRGERGVETEEEHTREVGVANVYVTALVIFVFVIFLTVDGLSGVGGGMALRTNDRVGVGSFLGGRGTSTGFIASISRVGAKGVNDRRVIVGIKGGRCASGLAVRSAGTPATGTGSIAIGGSKRVRTGRFIASVGSTAGISIDFGSGPSMSGSKRSRIAVILASRKGGRGRMGTGLAIIDSSRPPIVRKIGSVATCVNRAISCGGSIAIASGVSRGPALSVSGDGIGLGGTKACRIMCATASDTKGASSTSSGVAVGRGPGKCMSGRSMCTLTRGIISRVAGSSVASVRGTFTVCE